MQKAKKADSKLVSQILNGERATLWEYYKSYTPILKGFINQKIEDERDVDEILQNTLIASLNAFRDYTGESSLKTYVFAIAKHKIADFYRKRRIKTLLFSRFPAIEHILYVLTTPEDELDKLITKERVHEILHLLRPKYCQALKLHYLSELPVAKVGLKLGVSLKSAESILFRARREFAFEYVKQGYAIPTISKKTERSFQSTNSRPWTSNKEL